MVQRRKAQLQDDLKRLQRGLASLHDERRLARLSFWTLVLTPLIGWWLGFLAGVLFVLGIVSLSTTTLYITTVREREYQELISMCQQEMNAVEPIRPPTDYNLKNDR